jgi:hypothetical protein
LRKVIYHNEVRPEQLIDHVGDEVRILEVTQHRKTHYDTRHQPPFASSFCLGLAYTTTCKKTEQRGKEQYQCEYATRLIVEEDAHKEQKGVAHEQLVAKWQHTRNDNCKEHPKIQLRK